VCNNIDDENMRQTHVTNDKTASTLYIVHTVHTQTDRSTAW